MDESLNNEPPTLPPPLLENRQYDPLLGLPRYLRFDFQHIDCINCIFVPVKILKIKSSSIQRCPLEICTTFTAMFCVVTFVLFVWTILTPSPSSVLYQENVIF